MFTGIVLGTAQVSDSRQRDDVIEITFKNPPFLEEVQKGDSVAVDGICLTVEKVEKKEVRFVLAQDTLRTTGWSLSDLQHKWMNFELSLKIGGRLHGDFVTGHIDGMCVVRQVLTKGENRSLVVQLPDSARPFLWEKGSITLNGVSLTLQEVQEKGQIRVGLVPETLRQTNLSRLQPRDQATYEVSAWVRAIYHFHASGQPAPTKA